MRQIRFRRQPDWCVFDRSTGFLLPDGSVLSPDGSAVRLERWQALTPAERQGFPPLCLDLVVELNGEPELPGLRLDLADSRKPGHYTANSSVSTLFTPASSASTSSQRVMASRMLLRASSRVLPWE